MKSFIIATSLLMSSLAAFAQHAAGTLTIQPKVGLNITTITQEPDISARVGLAAGVEAEYMISDMFSFSAGALYSMQGAKQKSSFTEGTISVGYDITSKYDYINIPLMANVYVIKGLAVKAGLQPSFNVSSKNDGDVTIVLNGETKNYSVGEYTGDLDFIDSSANSFYFSIPVGASYEYKNVVFDARYNIGVSKIWKGSYSKHSVFQMTLGYKFSL
jgi:hypothetical protein